ncbi:conserved hypothetical protein [Solidesulfovibrio fructosivorans JJ]]|uniref:Uncharacterized protein n=1 Tax=Solidesulfovibrio fructosivorans JJ] TaxID=596151 RepID=E1JXX1_SOLFR|nr:conserved hypothetical protein [Solidesulfovibrio fructosivorans JJ]]
MLFIVSGNLHHPREFIWMHRRHWCIAPIGLPPRERGRPGRPGDYIIKGGTTPARAGKTHPTTSIASSYRDYPRASGEDADSPDTAPPLRGLPPRERGRLCVVAPSGAVTGTTPARAGKTPTASGKSTPGRDYPRASGENHGAISSSRSWMGLPPRERGRPSSHSASVASWGTTPARAGKTTPFFFEGCCKRDYPRASGEDKQTLRGNDRDWGLPPRERGRPGPWLRPRPW